MATITGTDASDFLVGTDDGDLVNGGLGNDTIRGLGGNDTLNGAEGDDDLNGGDGNDYLIGGAGNDILQGGMNSDTLEGGAGDDVLRGGKGFDSIDGGDGNDTIYSGLGQDTLTGGAGADVFVVRGSDPNFPGALKAPTITDFVAGTDSIVVEGATTADITAALAAQTTVDGGVSLSINGATVVVKGAGLTSLTAANVSNTVPTSTPGQTFTLTTGVDSIAGTGSDDTLNGLVDATAASGTVQITDTIDLGAGTDTFNLRVNGAVNVTATTTPTLTGVEVLNVTNLAGATNVDASIAPSLTTLNNVASLASITATNLATTANTIGIKDNTADGVDVTATYKAGLTGTSDKLNLNLTNAGATTVASANYALVTVNGAAVGDGFDIVDITAVGTNRLESLLVVDSGATTTLKTVNISGAGSTRIDTALDFAGTTGTVDASNATGAVNVTLGADDVKFTGGSGNDRVNVVATLTAADVLDGGAGTDVISQNLIASVAAANFANVTNFETLAITGQATGSLDTSFTPASITTFAFEGGVAAGFTGASKLVSGDTITFNSIDNTVTAATFALATPGGTNDTLNLKVTAQSANTAFTKMTTTGFENVNLDVKTGTDAAANTLTLTEMANANLQTLTITADEAITLGGAAWSTGDLTTLDASGVTKNVTVLDTVQYNNTGATLKTGTGSDSITFSVATNATLAVDAGGQSSTGADTLTLTGAQTGATEVDLSAADQITKVNGATNAIVQTGFENVTAAAVTGAGGLTLTGSSGSNSITASTAGTGATTINGGDGLDFISVDNGGAANASVDTIVESATTAANASIITGFNGGTDKFKYTGSLSNEAATNTDGIAAGEITTAASLAAGIAADAGDLVYVVTTDAVAGTATAINNLAAATAANYATLVAAAETALLAGEFNAAIAGLDAAFAANEAVLMTLHTDNLANGNGIVIRITNTDTTVANTLTAAEIEIVGTFSDTNTAAFAATDFVWA